MQILKNPEFTRNLLLELSPQRLLAMPGILALVFLIALSPKEHRAEALANSAAIAFLLLGFIWGTKKAASAVPNEVRERTWDFQRMTALDAWTMTWGKLFGSTIYAWYGCGLALFVFVLASLVFASPAHLVRVVPSAILTLIIVHAIAFIGGIDSIIRNPAAPRGIGVVPIVLGFCMLFSIPALARMSSETEVYLYWYGFNIPFIDVWLLSSIVFAGWTLLGAYRLMRVELLYVNRPWAWASFILFLMVYLAGFVPSDFPKSNMLTVRIYIAFAVALGATYLSIFTEAKNSVVFRKMFAAYERNDLDRCLAYCPRWALSWIILLGVSLIATFFTGVPDYSLRRKLEISMIPLPMCFFALRDIGIFIYFNLNPRSRLRADGNSIVLIIILYSLLPALLSAFGLGALNFLFLPTITSNVVVGCVPVIIECLIVWHLIRKKWAEQKI